MGESERGVRQCFQRARNSQPCVIFFDEIDALCPKRSDMDVCMIKLHKIQIYMFKLIFLGKWSFWSTCCQSIID